MDHQSSFFPVRHRQDLKSRRRRDLLPMASLSSSLTLFLLFLLLSSLLLVVKSEKLQLARRVVKNPDDPNNVTFLLTFPSSDEDKKTASSSDEEIPTDVQATPISTEKKRRIETIRCNLPPENGKKYQSGLSQCLLWLDAAILHSTTEKKRKVFCVIFNLYDLGELDRLRKNLAVKHDYYRFYVRCMPKTYYDVEDAECQGGPPQPLNPDQLIDGEYFEKEGKQVVLFKDPEVSVYYYGDISWWIQRNDFMEIKNGTTHVEFALTEPKVTIGRDSTGLYLVDGEAETETSDRYDSSSFEIEEKENGEDNAAKNNSPSEKTVKQTERDANNNISEVAQNAEISEEREPVNVTPLFSILSPKGNNQKENTTKYISQIYNTFPFDLNQDYEVKEPKIRIELTSMHFLTTFNSEVIPTGDEIPAYVFHLSLSSSFSSSSSSEENQQSPIRTVQRKKHLTVITCNVVNGKDKQEENCVDRLLLSKRNRKDRKYDIYVVSSKLSGMEGFTAKLYTYLKNNRKEPSVMFFLDKEEETKAPQSPGSSSPRLSRSSSPGSSSPRLSRSSSSRLSRSSSLGWLFEKASSSSPQMFFRKVLRRSSLPSRSSFPMSSLPSRSSFPMSSPKRSWSSPPGLSRSSSPGSSSPRLPRSSSPGSSSEKASGVSSPPKSSLSEALLLQFPGQEVVVTRNPMSVRDFSLATLKSSNAFRGNFLSDSGSGTICHKFIISFHPKYWSIKVGNTDILRHYFEDNKIDDRSKEMVFLKWNIGNFIMANSKDDLNLSTLTKYPQPAGDKLTLKLKREFQNRTDKRSKNSTGENKNSSNVQCNDKITRLDRKSTVQLSWNLQPTWIGTNRRPTDSDWIGWYKVPELKLRSWEYNGNFRKA